MVSGGIVHEVALISLPAGGEGALLVDEPLQEIDRFFRRENPWTYDRSSSPEWTGNLAEGLPAKGKIP